MSVTSKLGKETSQKMNCTIWKGFLDLNGTQGSPRPPLTSPSVSEQLPAQQTFTDPTLLQTHLTSDTFPDLPSWRLLCVRWHWLVHWPAAATRGVPLHCLRLLQGGIGEQETNPGNGDKGENEEKKGGGGRVCELAGAVLDGRAGQIQGSIYQWTLQGCCQW